MYSKAKTVFLSFLGTPSGDNPGSKCWLRFLDDEIFADKYYEIIFSDEIPGKLYQITTIIPDKSNESAEPLVMETLRLVDVKNQDS